MQNGSRPAPAVGVDYCKGRKITNRKTRRESDSGPHRCPLFLKREHLTNQKQACQPPAPASIHSTYL